MTVWYLLLALLASPAVGGDESAQCSQIPFKTGEMARFRVRVGPLKVGEGTVVLHSGTANSIPGGVPSVDENKGLWYLEGRGITTGIAAAFYSMDDWLALWIHADSLLPAYRAIGIRERNETAVRSIRFDHGAEVAEFRRDRQFYRRNSAREKITCRQKPLAADSFESISLFFYLRCVDMQAGETLVHSVHEDGKNLRVELHAVGLEKIETLWGKKEALRVRIRLLGASEGIPSRPLWVWVSNDRQRIPLYFVADLKFANLRGDLVGYRRSQDAAIEGELDPSFIQVGPEQVVDCPALEALSGG